MAAIDGFWAVVPAGGAGTRLWPLSRAGAPKFLLDLTGSGRTLLQTTADRLGPLVGPRMVVVTGARHAAAVAAQLPHLPASQLMAEPSPRDSMAAIGWAAAVLHARDPAAVVGSFAADHLIGDQGAFEACVREAVEVARSGLLVTIGIEPTYAATGFGYVRAGVSLPGQPTARRVEEFVEKPAAATAARYLSEGTYRWNAGMFVVRAAVLLDLLEEWHPDLVSGLRAIAADPARLDRTWQDLTRISIDHAIAEPAAAAGHVAVIPGTFPWDDIGDFASLAGLLPASNADRPGPTVLGDAGRVTAVDSTGLVVPSSGRMVAVVGLDDVVVVDTPDALLVTTRARAQDVRVIVDLLAAGGHADLT